MRNRPEASVVPLAATCDPDLTVTLWLAAGSPFRACLPVVKFIGPPYIRTVPTTEPVDAAVTDEDVVAVVVGVGSVAEVVDAPAHPATSRTDITGMTRTGNRMAL